MTQRAQTPMCMCSRVFNDSSSKQKHKMLLILLSRYQEQRILISFCNRHDNSLWMQLRRPSICARSSSYLLCARTYLGELFLYVPEEITSSHRANGLIIILNASWIKLRLGTSTCYQLLAGKYGHFLPSFCRHVRSSTGGFLFVCLFLLLRRPHLHFLFLVHFPGIFYSFFSSSSFFLPTVGLARTQK